MIEVTKLNGVKVLVNEDLIETVEETPDTVLTLTNGKKILIKERRQEVKNLVKSFKRDIFGPAVLGADGDGEA
ncbi:MAG: flagellar FlbD family protein [Lachnospiraceae bacterium]|nr:flagellar FlbD family protein [Lachnospiraceae bacterium]